ncbi:LytTR family DNA-binding domain-containing protein [Cytobacillus praedii]|uniref:Histidine kinase n=1 Tax=Cytobacillus solani TaxID=1637975 RepID=A0A0Q3QUE0_9BACI|nr:LytTR family DNA-binding domain-containing protein [Cytobacillus solani]KOP79905.1 histidine kinase [Bacillus sp. FJAT-21945]KQL21216.1 histidine kinase [Cytobacillus solani]USK54520.1 LytTR family transcriptional regulator DNA-binding domain-containing protein [Cytobacillus solani]
MEIEVKIDSAYKEPKVIIITDKITDEVKSVMKKISKNQKLTVFSEEEAIIVEADEIIRIYSENKKVYVQTNHDTYSIRMRLYELEEKLALNQFIRISQSELINRNQIVSLDISLTGTIGVLLKSDIKTFASRRYVSKIKKQLGI